MADRCVIVWADPGCVTVVGVAVCVCVLVCAGVRACVSVSVFRISEAWLWLM